MRVLRFYRLVCMSVAVFLLSACGGPNQSTPVMPQSNGAPSHHHLKRNASGCFTIQDSTGATYTAAQLGGGNPLDVDYSATPCQIGIYINGANGPNTLDQTKVNGPFAIGIYFDTAGNGAREDHTQICVNGSNSEGGCLSGTATSVGTGLDIRNTPKFSADHTSIDSYTAGFATNPCPNNSNNMMVDHTTITNATYPWSYEGGNNNFNFQAGHDSPPFQGNNCAGSSVGAGLTSKMMFVVDGFHSQVNAYKLPLSPGASPQFSMSTGSFSFPYEAAINSQGDLFVIDINHQDVLEYVPPYTGPYTVLSSITLSNPGILLVDSYGDLIVSSNNGGGVEVLAAPYTGSPLAITNGLSGQVWSMGLDQHADLFVSNGGPFEEYTYPFSASGGPVATISGGSMSPQQPVFDQAGDGFFPWHTGGLYEYLSPYTGAGTQLTNGINDPSGLQIEPNGNLLVESFANDDVTEYLPPYTGAPISTITNDINTPNYSAMDGAGNFFVYNQPAFGDSNLQQFVPPFSSASLSVGSAYGYGQQATGPHPMVLLPTTAGYTPAVKKRRHR